MDQQREEYAEPESPLLRPWVRVLLSLLLAFVAVVTLIGGALLLIELMVMSGPRFDD